MSRKHGMLSMRFSVKKSENIDDNILKFMKGYSTEQLTNQFAKEFTENVRKITHQCVHKTLYSEELNSMSNSFFLDETSEIEVFNI